MRTTLSSLARHCSERPQFSRVSLGFVQDVEYAVAWTSSFTDGFVCLIMYIGVGWTSFIVFWVSNQKLGKWAMFWIFGYPIMRSCRLMDKCALVVLFGSTSWTCTLLCVCYCELNILLLLLLCSTVYLSCLFVVYLSGGWVVSCKTCLLMSYDPLCSDWCV